MLIQLTEMIKLGFWQLNGTGQFEKLKKKKKILRGLLDFVPGTGLMLG